MPTTRVAQPEIQSWTPAVDARAAETGSIFLLNGANYFFDSEGPRSGFGSYIMKDMSLEQGLFNVYYIEQPTRSILLASTAAYDRRYTTIDSQSADPSTGYWFKLADFDQEPDSRIGRVTWTNAYVGYSTYACHPWHGMFKILSDTFEPYAGTADVEDPIAICETNGRLVILTKTLTMWSNAFDAENLTPELGGAGFQVTAETVPGDAIMVTSFGQGCLVWTTGGVMMGEYIGGDPVFRWSRLTTDQLLINAAAWTTLAVGDVVVTTKQGIFRSNSSTGLSPLSQLFNEYLRRFIKDSPNALFRLNYIREMDHLYVQILDETSNYNRTYIYSVGMDKWGQIAFPHKGICRFSSENGDYGYIDLDGYAHRFHDLDFNENLDGSISGLDAFIEVGYIRPSSGALSADIEFEIQEIVTSAVTTAKLDTVVIEEDWNGPTAFVSFNIGFYNSDEDWNGFGISDYDEDWSYMTGDEDYNLLPSADSIDWNASVIGPHQFDWNDPAQQEDWGLTPEGGVDTSYIIDWEDGVKNAPDEDWNGLEALYNVRTYQLESVSNLDGLETELTVYPSLARRANNTDLWTCFTSGHQHRLIYKATQPFEKFHVRTLAATVSYQGQIS